MNRISVIAPHFQEYSLLFANALSRHGPVRLFIDLKRLKSEFSGRQMPVAANVTIQHVGLNSILDVFRIFSGCFNRALTNSSFKKLPACSSRSSAPAWSPSPGRSARLF
ncbi:hypothetical protein ACU4GH_20105 [Bradyrhizobium betae]|uniref:hypothetical protein n=1 Tax=Bradyrhizobium betae TaxID=244734 RepID=UPI003D67373C